MISKYIPSEKVFENDRGGDSQNIPIFCAAPTHFLPDIRRELESHFNIFYGYNLSYDEVSQCIDNVQAMLVNPGARYKIDRNLLKKAPYLKFIVTPSTGSDHIDKEYCEQNGIVVKALKGHEDVINSIHASAEFSFALLMAMIRKLPYSMLGVQSGYWRDVEDDFRGIELNGKKVGLVGYGRIGKKMSRFLQAFQAEIFAYDPYVTIEDPWVTQIAHFDQILADSDIVCVHVHLDDSTKNMFDAKAFAKMKKGSYFLNTSRGGIVDEQALLQALQSEHIYAAALDVVKNEQSDELFASPLFEYAKTSHRLIITPHIAGLTVDSQRKAAKFAVNELKQFFNLV